MPEDLHWISLVLATLSPIGAAIAFLWARAKTEANRDARDREQDSAVKAGLNRIGTRIDRQEEKLSDAIDRCKERQDRNDGRLAAIEGLNIMTIEAHIPVRETCRQEIFHLIQAQEKKSDKTDEDISDLKTCLHRMDKNIATLLAYQGKGETQ